MLQTKVSNTASDPVVVMARRLSALWNKSNELEEQALQHEKESDEYKGIQRSTEAIITEREALQNYVLSIPCQSLAGAAVHIMLAYSLNEICSSSDNCDDVYPQIDRALYSALAVVANAAGIDMSALGSEIYTPKALNPFGPDVLAA